MQSSNKVLARLAILGVAAVLLTSLLPLPSEGAIDPESYNPCSVNTSTVAPCNGAVGGGPSPTLLCWPGHPTPLYWAWASTGPPPMPNAGGAPRGCVNLPGTPPPPSPKCIGGENNPPTFTYWGECTPFALPEQVMSATSFWDAKLDAAFILGGFNSVGGSETSNIVRFTRGMPRLPWPDIQPHGPGGTANGAQFPSAGNLPVALGNQALAWDPVSRTAYLFGGYNGAALTNQIFSYRPDEGTVTTLAATLPNNFDLMAGTWNPTPTPTCPVGCAYLFGGRMGQLQVQSGSSVNVNCVGHSDKVYLFEPTSGQIIESPWRLPQSYYGMTAVAVGTSIYVFGGQHQDNAVVDENQAEQVPQVWVCDPTAPPTYAGNIGLTGLPAPRNNCDIYRFDVLEGGSIRRMNPYAKPTDTPPGPAWGAGTNVPATNFCPGMRVGAAYDGRFIFALSSATIPPCSIAGLGTTVRMDPTAPVPTTWNLGGIIQNLGCAANGVAQVGELGYTTMVFDGCSAYAFGGLIDPSGLTPPPDGPLSDKAMWIGKCRPQALLRAERPYSCVGWPVRFDASASQRGEADIAWVEWNFGDGTPPVSGHWTPLWDPNGVQPVLSTPMRQVMSHGYANPGGYVVTMRITDLAGFQSSATPLFVKIKQDTSCRTPVEPPIHHDDPLDGFFLDGPEIDSDQDGLPDLQDNCPSVPNHDQLDLDFDLIGDACQETPPDVDVSVVPNDPVAVPAPDADHDGIPDAADNCPAVPNHDQLDQDTDATGDACDSDADGDGVPNDGPDGSFLDNCPLYPNTDQQDGNGDGLGDACVLSQTKAPPAATPPGRNAAAVRSDDAALPAPLAFGLAALAAVVTALVLVLVLRRGLQR